MLAWLMIGKIALLGLLVLGGTVLVTTYVHKRRSGPPPLWDYNAAGYLDLIREPPRRERYRHGLKVLAASDSPRVYALIDRR